MAAQRLGVITRSLHLDNLVIPAPARITDFKHLASYSWWDNPTPTISVPGKQSSSLPLWSSLNKSPKRTLQLLSPSPGNVYIDEKGARNPSSPLEPLFRALSIMRPSFKLGDVDLVIDRNTIRKLFLFVLEGEGRKTLAGYDVDNLKDPFQIRVEVIRPMNTVLFTLVEPKSFDAIKGMIRDSKTFEKDAERLCAHYRVVAYNFGGLRCVVRHETDGYLDSGKRKNGVGGQSRLEESAPDPETTMTKTGLTIVKRGPSGRMADVDVSATLEIKTRTANRKWKLPIEDVCFQLWASQTPNLAAGRYLEGSFTEFRVSDYTGTVAHWEKVNQRPLEKFAGLLARIIHVVKDSDAGRAVIEYNWGSLLDIFADADGQPSLPEDLYKWENEPVAMVAANQAENKEGMASLLPPHIPVQLASDIQYAMEEGPGEFFNRIPPKLSRYRNLCQTLRSLPPEVLNKVLRGWSFTLTDIMNDLRKGRPKKDDKDCLRGQEILARNAAFRLVYKLLSGQVEKKRDLDAAYNAVLFVLSHTQIFNHETRVVVRMAFQECTPVKDKQHNAMNQWVRLLRGWRKR
ncbi:hypothetical protein V8F20_008592 [Naviculisporaceae sp. PSN 640]